MIFLQFSCNRLHVRLCTLGYSYSTNNTVFSLHWKSPIADFDVRYLIFWNQIPDSILSAWEVVSILKMSAVTGAVKSAIVKMEDKYRSPYAIYRMAPFSMILNELEWLSKFLIHELNGNLPKPTIFVQWSFTTVLRITFGYVIYWCNSCFMFIFACASSCCFNYVSTLPPLFREGTCVDVVFGNHARTKIK